MKDYVGKLQYNDKTYPIVFNINVMEVIQEKYGTIQKWGELTDGKEGETDAKAMKFGFTAMLNEALEMEAERNGTPFIPLTEKQVGRMLTAIGIENAQKKMQETVIESSKSEEKNL